MSDASAPIAPVARKPSSVTIEDEREDGTTSEAREIPATSPPVPAATATGLTKESVPTNNAPAPTSSSASSSSSSSSIGPDPRQVFLPVKLLSIHTTYIAKSNHFLQCDPIVVVAVENKPVFKTSIRNNSTDCQWDLSQPADVQAVPGGLKLSGAPVLQIPVSDLATSKLQVHQEDFSKLKVDDDMGGFSVHLEEIVTRSWKAQEKKTAPVVPAPSSTAASSLDATATPAAAVATVSASVDGWYPVSIDSASLVDRVTGRHLGEISLKLSVQLEPYLQYLVASQSGLHLLYELTQQFLSTPSTETPLRHILLNAASLKAFIAFVVKAGQDKGSMDGERMRERLYPLIHKALDVFKPETQILNTFFADDSVLWKELFNLRKSVPLSSLSSHAQFQKYESFIDAHIHLVERVGLLLEPLPPPPVKTEEELAIEAAAEAAAAKRAAQKEKKRRQAAIAAGEDPDDIPPPKSASKKKKGILSGSTLPEPPVHLPSKLQFGLHTLDLLHEVFEVFHIRLSGFKKQQEIDWTNEAKMVDLVHCCEFLYKFQAFLFRYGEWSALATVPIMNAEGTGEIDQGRRRIGNEEVRSFFLKETGDANALWFQKQLVSCVKKTRDWLAETNKELFVKLQQHAEFWIKHYPVEKKEKSSTDKKKH